MPIHQSSFGKTSTGESVDRFECINANGLSMSLISYGAVMQSILTPDRDGKLENVNLGCDSIEDYEACVAYFGATVGRFCNRIGKARFELDGKEYELAANNPPNCLHGGVRGFSHAVWKPESIETDDAVGVKFHHVSPDGDENFPGELNVTAEYTLNNLDELKIEFRATTDQKTVLNLTNHNYWNLGGVTSGSILDHVLRLFADEVLDVDETLIPTGRLLDVAGSDLDFRDPTRIGDRIESLNQTPANGYDHCYVIRGGAVHPSETRPAASVHDPKSGRLMEVETTQPGIQLYTGNWLDGSPGSGGFGRNEAFCLETQHFPDSPNIPSFPTTSLAPGEEFLQTTIHRFRVE